VDYVITWFENDTREAVYENARQAIEFAKGLIDAGRRSVEIRMPRTNSVIRGQAILDIYDAIENPDAD
jgi:hypothetical protein